MQLKLKNITVVYDQHPALTNINLSINDREIVAVLGANGAGKSTLARTIMGLEVAKEGAVLVDSKDVSHYSCSERVNEGMSLVPETRAVFPGLTVEQNLKLGCFLDTSETFKERLYVAYQLFPRLDQRQNQLAGNLSGGEQQMLALARAFIQSPKLLILDEPSLGLSPKLTDIIFEKIKHISESGCSIMLIEQKASQALQIANRGYILSLGHIALSGASTEIIKNHQVQQIYLGTG